MSHDTFKICPRNFIDETGPWSIISADLMPLGNISGQVYIFQFLTVTHPFCSKHITVCVVNSKISYFVPTLVEMFYL